MPVTRLGVAGLGWLGEALIREVPRVPNLTVTAVQDVIADRARLVAFTYDVRWCGERYEDLIRRDDVDAVVICTPNGLHASQAQAALLAGKDVLVQKPLALTAADARRTADVAAHSRRLLFVDYSYRFLDTIRMLHDNAKSVRSARAAFHNIYGPGVEKAWFFDPSKSGGGALMDLGVHLLDLGFWLAAPSQVDIRDVEFSDERPVEHAAQVRLGLDDVPFSVEVSWNAQLPATEIFFEVEAENGPVRWENVDGSFFHFRTRREESVLLDRETTLREDTLRAFARAVEDRQPPPIDLRVYEVIDRAYAVVRSGSERLP